jgi:hypothetical protein
VSTFNGRNAKVVAQEESADAGDFWLALGISGKRKGAGGNSMQT